MTASVVTVIAVVAGMVWLAIMGVSAIRNRGSEEIAPNLAPGLTDAEIETRRLETGQKVAIALSAFLAISLPLYFLGEQDRQESFVEEFSVESASRGQHLVAEFKCFDCHGPNGTGGSASYVEKRSNVTVSWTAPSLNDVLYRYDEDELNFWVTFGRGNTPMPAWGLAGGGPLNEAEVVDVVNFLKTIQIPQAEVLEELAPAVSVEINDLADAEATMAAAILKQRQTIGDIQSAPAEIDAFVPLADRADALMEGAGDGIDTDADGISDSVEAELSALSLEVYDLFQVVDDITLDPAVADAELADEAVTQLESSSERDPILEGNLATVQNAIEGGTVDADVGLSSDALVLLSESLATAEDLSIDNLPPNIEGIADADDLIAALTAMDAPEEVATLLADAQSAYDSGIDTDGDGLSDGAETVITAQMASALTATIPTQAKLVALDPTNPASVGGVADSKTANGLVGGYDSLRITLGVTANNQEKFLANEQKGLDFLLNAQEQMAWDVDYEGVAEAMGGSVEEATQAVGLFNANCARCHTAGFSAGLPYRQEIGSGGFGPALWDGRPLVQFGQAAEEPKDDLLIQFLIKGSEAQQPYGLNGFGSGRMPSFGALLSADDIALLARYLRGGNLDGK